MIPQPQLDRASQLCWDAGIRVLQGYRLAASEADHVQALLNYMQPEANSLWIDVGSGFGEVARLMCEARPDLSFFLVNNNQFQIDHSPADFRTLNADMHALPLGDGVVDGCMFLWSLCHADDPQHVLNEAARVTRRGGRVFVFDFEREAGSNAAMVDFLCARAYAMPTWRAMADEAGLRITRRIYPMGSDRVFRSLIAPDDEARYEQVFREVLPVIWTAVRR